MSVALAVCPCSPPPPLSPHRPFHILPPVPPSLSGPTNLHERRGPDEEVRTPGRGFYPVHVLAKACIRGSWVKGIGSAYPILLLSPHKLILPKAGLRYEERRLCESARGSRDHQHPRPRPAHTGTHIDHERFVATLTLCSVVSTTSKCPPGPSPAHQLIATEASTMQHPATRGLPGNGERGGAWHGTAPSLPVSGQSTNCWMLRC